jgi:hypothetical protein
MKIILDQFKDNIQRIRNLHSIYTHLSSNISSIIDISDVLRAELAFAVSAFDYYIHGLVRVGMFETFNSKRLETAAYKKFNVPLEKMKDAISNPASLSWLISEITDQHSRKSFQRSDNVSEAIRLVSDIKIWDEIAKRQGKNASDLKNQLDLIVARRNQIVHEADMDPSSGNRWPINDTMVNDAIDFIEKIADTIYDILK